jgi:CubicO group peptidase (beta-lactamase class C family)
MVGKFKILLQTLIVLPFVILPLAAQTKILRAPDEKNIEAAEKYNAEAGGFSFIVMRDGRIVREAYGNGGSADRVNLLASGSKSFVGVLAAAAVQDGLMKFDELAVDTLSEWKTDKQKSKITLRQLLNLSSGLLPGEEGSATNSPAWADIIGKPMTNEPGAKFDYGAYSLNAFGEILQRKLKAKTGESYEQYMNRRLLAPLGIKVDWRIRCADGNPQLGGGAFMTARDWATFGEFARLGGRWKNKKIIDEKILSECFIGAKTNPAYGLTWWLKKSVGADLMKSIPTLNRDMGEVVSADWLPEDLVMAAGAGKQRLYISRSLKLVVVVQRPYRDAAKFADIEFLSRLFLGKELESKPGRLSGRGNLQF